MPEICLMTKAWRSGAAWVAQMLAQAIAEQGATIAFVAPLADPAVREPSHPRLQRHIPSRELVGDYSKPTRVAASLARIATSTFAIIRLRRNTKSFIFSIPEPLVVTLPLFFLLRVSRARVIYIVHDAQPHAWSLPDRMRWIERGAHLLSYRFSSQIVALTPSVKTALIDDFGVSPTKIHIIPHGPFSLGDVEPAPGNGRMLIFGSLRRNKCVLEVINGVKLARREGANTVLVLAGEPLKQERGYWDQCLAAIAEDPTGFDVHEGFLPDEDLPQLIKTVDCFILAYRDFNSQSGVGVLAALAGRPVIGTRSGGLGELFERGLSGETIDGQVTESSIAAVIKTFNETNTEEWRRRALSSAAAIAETLRWDTIADDYISLVRGN